MLRDTFFFQNVRGIIFYSEFTRKVVNHYSAIRFELVRIRFLNLLFPGFPTGPFTIIEPPLQEIGEFYIVQESHAANFEAPKSWKGRSGCIVLSWFFICIQKNFFLLIFLPGFSVFMGALFLLGGILVIFCFRDLINGVIMSVRKEWGREILYYEWTIYTFSV